MTSEREAALARAQATLASVEHTLAVPRSNGPRYSLGHPDESYDAWQARKRAEAEAVAAPARRAPAPAPRNALSGMSNDQVAAFLGGIAGELRREMLGEVRALAELLADLERRVAKLEGKDDEE